MYNDCSISFPLWALFPSRFNCYQSVIFPSLFPAVAYNFQGCQWWQALRLPHSPSGLRSHSQHLSKTGSIWVKTAPLWVLLDWCVTLVIMGDYLLFYSFLPVWYLFPAPPLPPSLHSPPHHTHSGKLIPALGSSKDFSVLSQACCQDIFPPISALALPFHAEFKDRARVWWVRGLMHTT